MKDRDVALILKKVTSADSATYKFCVLTQREKRSKRAVETIRVINPSVVPPGE